MNMGKKITELREGTKVPRESRYVVEMGDGTGTKQVKHHNLVAQLLEDMSLGYDETMEFLNGTGIAEGNEALRAFRDWLVSRVVNNLMTTEAGFFLDGRAGKTLADGLAEINSNLADIKIYTDISQLGLTTSASLLDVCKAMRQPSIAFLRIGQDAIYNSPANFSIMTVKKLHTNIIVIVEPFASNISGRMYRCSGNITELGIWYQVEISKFQT